ncbi:MAG: leucyl aminopeptidase family protein [Rhodobacteraceae bacterium]|nr:leucyl aminopeptidase family protein [Paracoccaceae bacterium]
MSFLFAEPTTNAVPLHVLDPDQANAFLAKAGDRVRRWADASGFTGSGGDVVMVPDDAGHPTRGLIGFGTPTQRKRGRFMLAKAAAKLPMGTYQLVTDLPVDILETECLGWILAGYTFTRYRDVSVTDRRLVAPDGVDTARIQAIAAGEVLTRDLINTPASDMGPDALERAIQDIGDHFGAAVTSIVGDTLLDQNFSMIHTVGRASAVLPRLVELRHGDSGPKLTLVGKGVCFDTGGLNIKPGSSMGLMKKDMGGAATVLGLARTILALELPVQLRVLIPAVENAIAGSAFRPGDILTSRKGLTVEINNTDAEGRLVLADALALADEVVPDLIVSMATLTGAARVAVGPDIAPFYCDVDSFAAALETAAGRVADPVWRMPFHDPYETMIEPGIADLDNAPKDRFAGSIIAALFLRRFVENAPYIHFDIYGWQPSAAPARPKGGVGQGARALLDALPNILNL